MGEFKCLRVFNEEPAFKENDRMGGAWHARPYQSDFHWEKYVDGPVYRKILKKEAFLRFTVMKKFSKFWFQQNGAKAHTADLTLDLVETHFKKRVILNHFPLKKKEGWSWLLYSPDLGPLDYFLWSYVKDRRYTNRLTMISVLRKNITDIFDSLREDSGIFSLVTWNFRRRLEQIVEREGGHIENVIIKLSSNGTPIKFCSFYNF